MTATMWLMTRSPSPAKYRGSAARVSSKAIRRVGIGRVGVDVAGAGDGATLVAVMGPWYVF